MRLFPRLLSAALCAPAAVFASGQLDPAFGGDGIVTVDASEQAVASERFTAGLIDHAGRYIGVGSGTGFGNVAGSIVRLRRDGTRDAGFGNNGVVRMPLVPGYAGIEWKEVVQLPDQRLVVAGRAQNGPNQNDAGTVLVCRLLDNGGLDGSFGTAGCFTQNFVVGSERDSVEGMALQADGKLLITGQTDLGSNGLPYEWVVARYLEDGTRDPCFGAPNCIGGGIVVEPEPDSDIVNFLPADIAVDGAGRIVVAGNAVGAQGQDFAVVRLLPSGAVDAAGFGNQGHRLVNFGLGGGNGDIGRAVAVRADGAIFVAGTAQVNLGRLAAVAALDAVGAPLPGFGVQGKTTFFFNDVALDHIPQRAVLQADGKLLVAGDADDSGDPNTLLRDCGIARLRADGMLDPVFAFEGRTTFDVAPGDNDTFTERCNGLAANGTRIALFGTHQPMENTGEFDALAIVLEQDDLFRNGFE